ncbi:uncharacterized protein MYCFIDRAFT_180405 [Pseudocercospora fijiensis CIRAD86]|uniref:Uncharacterized protein n=1 Tax=Pseudocercospora fijiensis (strain CIRAD86) TaxID=383855 RepID=M3AHT0_PSEFD|nr:uncharacterized protein MYCFIDRAFT_180405 [Pseudocercospora fijiensis CIRAD86]EME77072.1 hypothetical protein MYCFIDRAFT_180405 [Pseudocercospora fijiensis CIRAD86]
MMAAQHLSEQPFSSADPSRSTGVKELELLDSYWEGQTMRQLTKVRNHELPLISALLLLLADCLNGDFDSLALLDGYDTALLYSIDNMTCAADTITEICYRTLLHLMAVSDNQLNLHKFGSRFCSKNMRSPFTVHKTGEFPCVHAALLNPVLVVRFATSGARVSSCWLSTSSSTRKSGEILTLQTVFGKRKLRVIRDNLDKRRVWASQQKGTRKVEANDKFRLSERLPRIFLTEIPDQNKTLGLYGAVLPAHEMLQMKSRLRRVVLLAAFTIGDFKSESTRVEGRSAIAMSIQVPLWSASFTSLSFRFEESNEMDCITEGRALLSSLCLDLPLHQRSFAFIEVNSTRIQSSSKAHFDFITRLLRMIMVLSGWSSDSRLVSIAPSCRTTMQVMNGRKTSTSGQRKLGADKGALECGAKALMMGAHLSVSSPVSAILISETLTTPFLQVSWRILSASALNPGLRGWTSDFSYLANPAVRGIGEVAQYVERKAKIVVTFAARPTKQFQIHQFRVVRSILHPV